MIDCAAGADDLAFHIFGVDIRFHESRETYLNPTGAQVPIALLPLELVAALGRIEQIGNCAENQLDARTEKEKSGNHDHRHHGQDQCVFNQRLSLAGDQTVPDYGQESFNMGSH